MITDVLITLVTTLINKGFKIPIHIFMVSKNGNIVAAKYSSGNGKSKVQVLLEHIEDPDWQMPINSFFTDATGRSETIKLDPDSIKGHN